ncbi:hypothetical protein BN1723_020242, partial [Verticillium longisporum]
DHAAQRLGPQEADGALEAAPRPEHVSVPVRRARRPAEPAAPRQEDQGRRCPRLDAPATRG